MAARTQNWLVAAGACLLLAGRAGGEEQSASAESMSSLLPAVRSIFASQEPGPHAFSANVRFEAIRAAVENWPQAEVKAQEPDPQAQLATGGEVFGAREAQVSPHLFSKGMQ